MFVTGDRQRARSSIGANGLDSLSSLANGADAGNAKSKGLRSLFSLRLVTWREGKEQLIIFASGQCQRHRVESSRCSIGAAGGREGKRAKIEFRADMAFFTDMAEIAGQAVRYVDG